MRYDHCRARVEEGRAQIRDLGNDSIREREECSSGDFGALTVARAQRAFGTEVTAGNVARNDLTRIWERDRPGAQGDWVGPVCFALSGPKNSLSSSSSAS